MGKRLIIAGANFEDVALGKLRISIEKTILTKNESTTLTLSAPSITSPTLNASTSGSIITLTQGENNTYTIQASENVGEQVITCTLSYDNKSETKEITIKVIS